MDSSLDQHGDPHLASVSADTGKLTIGSILDFNLNLPFAFYGSVYPDSTALLTVYSALDSDRRRYTVRLARGIPGGPVLWRMDAITPPSANDGVVEGTSLAVSPTRLMLFFTLEEGGTFVRMIDPATRNFTTKQISSGHGYVTAASNGHDIVLVRQTPSSDIFATRIDANGNALDGDGVLIAHTGVSYSPRKVVPFASSDFLIAWIDHGWHGARFDARYGTIGPSLQLADEGQDFQVSRRVGGNGAVMFFTRDVPTGDSTVRMIAFRELTATPPRRHVVAPH